MKNYRKSSTVREKFDNLLNVYKPSKLIKEKFEKKLKLHAVIKAEIFRGYEKCGENWFVRFGI
jgi:hypothetical protein